MPPNLRVVEASAWVKVLKQLDDLFGTHADAGVRTRETTIHSRPSMFSRPASSVMLPSWVNLAALDKQIEQSSGAP